MALRHVEESPEKVIRISVKSACPSGRGTADIGPITSKHAKVTVSSPSENLSGQATKAKKMSTDEDLASNKTHSKTNVAKDEPMDTTELEGIVSYFELLAYMSVLIYL